MSLSVPFRTALAAAVLLVPATAQTIACFDTTFGTNLGLGDDTGAQNLALGFTFNFGGQGYTTISVCSNGYLWLGSPPNAGALIDWDYSPSVAELLQYGARICPMWNDFNPTIAGSGQIWFNAVPAAGGNPARAVITWDRVFEYQRTTPITMQVQLIDDGRIMFFYDPSITAVLGGFAPGNQLVGLTQGGNATANPVTWSTLPITTTTATAHELFASGQFNLIGRALEMVPAGAGYVMLPRTQCVVGNFVKVGNGCPHDLTFYESFNIGAVDLANGSVRLVPVGGGFTAVPGPGLDQGYSNVVAMVDDAIVPTPLAFPFPFAGTTHNTVDVCSNGYLNLASGTAAQFLVQAATFLAQNARVAPLWVDLNPALGGLVHIDSSAAQLMVTWVAVPEYGQAANLNTLQVKLLPSGEIIFSYGALTIAAQASLAGITQGGGAPDAGSMDISGSLPFQLGAAGAVAVKLDAATGSRPGIGSTFRLNASNLPTGSGLAALLLAFGTANNNLSGLGMPTCRGYLNPAGAVSVLGTVQAGSAAFNLALPNNQNLLGLQVDTQAAAFSPGVNPLGVVVSNGGRINVAL